jgi:sodium/proline symporter
MEYVVIVCYFAVLLAIGAAAARRVRDLGDYYVGGKRLGYWVVAVSARASGESAWLYLGLTGLGALVGARAFQPLRLLSDLDDFLGKESADWK